VLLPLACTLHLYLCFTVCRAACRYPHIQGVQFHPESIITQNGKRIVANFLRIVGQDPQEGRAAAAAPAAAAAAPAAAAAAEPSMTAAA
jgi:hypothetical protein